LRKNPIAYLGIKYPLLDFGTDLGQFTG